MSGTPTIREQASAVELAAVNRKGHVDNLRNLVRQGKRPAHELNLAESYLPALQAAAVTLKFMEKHADMLRKMMGEAAA